MNHDTKVGLGLGILLVGIVSAFYFREQPTLLDPLPEIQSVEALDREISESLAVVDKSVTPLEKFESQYKSDFKLDEIETEQDLPAVSHQPVKIEVDLTEEQTKTEVGKVEEGPVPTFDPEFEFLNEPTADESVASSPESPAKQSYSDSASKSESSQKLPATAVVQSENNPPKELPAQVEMFSEDLDSAPLNDDEIPLQLAPITVQSPAQPERKPDARVIHSEPDKITPQPAPVRDPRIIVPKRVRLNEPIARRTIEEMRSPGTTGKNEKVRSESLFPSAEKDSEPFSDSANQGLPTLEGLEPLDPSR